jgi:thiamine-phosphate pyrophosphorylase
MRPRLQLPIIYPITTGETTTSTTAEDPSFASILTLVETAVSVSIPILQLREKKLNTKNLFQLSSRAVELARESATSVLVNDRFDVALAAGAAGVHLTSQSVRTNVVRSICGSDFLIGVSTHTLEEAQAARDEGADFIVFGPVFETDSKRDFGSPRGVEELQRVTSELKDFPVVAIGGIGLKEVAECFAAGASGVAAIRLLSDAQSLSVVAQEIREQFRR